MQSVQEFQFMSQFLGDGAWLKIAFLVFLSGVMLFKSEAIKVKTLYRLSCILFALSLMIPGVATVFAIAVMSALGDGPGGTTLLSLSGSLAGVAFGVSVLCGLLSLGGAEADAE